MFTRTVIPQIEARIEERLLHEYMKTITSELERKELFDSYILRRHRLSQLPEEADMFGESKDRSAKEKIIKTRELTKTVKNIEGTGIKHHNFSDIGTYTVFPKQARKRLFPSKVYGRIEEDEVKETDTFGIMCRE